MTVAPLVDPEESERALGPRKRLERQPHHFIVMGRTEHLDMVFLDEFTKELPKLRHHSVVKAVVDLVDQKDPVP